MGFAFVPRRQDPASWWVDFWLSLWIIGAMVFAGLLAWGMATDPQTWGGTGGLEMAALLAGAVILLAYVLWMVWNTSDHP